MSQESWNLQCWCHLTRRKGVMSARVDVAAGGSVERETVWLLEDCIFVCDWFWQFFCFLLCRQGLTSAQAVEEGEGDESEGGETEFWSTGLIVCISNLGCVLASTGYLQVSCFVDVMAWSALFWSAGLIVCVVLRRRYHTLVSCCAMFMEWCVPKVKLVGTASQLLLYNNSKLTFASRARMHRIQEIVESND